MVRSLTKNEFLELNFFFIFFYFQKTFRTVSEFKPFECQWQVNKVMVWADHQIWKTYFSICSHCFFRTFFLMSHPSFSFSPFFYFFFFLWDVPFVWTFQVLRPVTQIWNQIFFISRNLNSYFSFCPKNGELIFGRLDISAILQGIFSDLVDQTPKSI